MQSQALAMRRKLLRDRHPALIESLYELALNFAATDRDAEANDNLREAMNTACASSVENSSVAVDIERLLADQTPLSHR